MKKKVKQISKFRKYTLLIVIVMITIFCIETVGYAQISRLIKIGGDVTWKVDGKLLITNVTQVSLTRATQNSTPTFEGKQVGFNVTLSPTSNNNNGAATAIYDVTLTNNSSFVHTFTNSDITSNFNNTNRVTTTVQVTGLTEGQRIEPGSTATFRVTIRGVRRNAMGGGNNNTATGTTTIVINTNALSNGNLLATLSNDEGNLIRNPIESFHMNVMNTRPYAQTLTLSSTSDKIEIVNSTGGNLGNLSVNGSETTSLDFYVKAKDTAMFGQSPYKANVILTSSDGTVIDLGTITLVVPTAGNVTHDGDAPVISNVTASKNSTDGSVTVSYSGSDESAISSYYIVPCKENNGSYTCGDAKPSSTTSYTFTGLEYGTYIFKVYAEDEWGNVATPSEINAATTSSGHASTSTSAFYRWKVNVNFSLTNMYYDGTNTSGTVSVDYMQDYTFTLTTFGNNYDMPNTITVANSSGNLTAGTGYSFQQNNGNVTIYGAYVTENLNVSATSNYNWCLAEGTQIKLADGTYKNIEDIRYNDLLSAWSYDSGSITKEFPIWLEKGDTTKSYQLNTFSDGTTLKTVGYHGVYSVDDNMFISVDDYDHFKVGTTILKVDKNNKLYKVKVTDIKIVNEKVKYYHVVSTRYYNVIANDVLTTDGTVILSNLYGFDKNLKWKNKTYDRAYSYDDFKDIIPYYMYVGMRMHEGIYLQDYGLDLQTFKYYLSMNQVNPRLLREVPKIGSKHIFYVAIDNKTKQVLEGDTFVLPGEDNKYLNTTDNKIYNSKDKVKIYTSTYFERVK